MHRYAALTLAAAALVAACASGPEPVLARPTPAPAESAPLPVASAPQDALGPRPEVREPASFSPPAASVLKGPAGSTIWLLERRALPLVSIAAVVPVGSAHDPDGKGGLAHLVADMLDEGAGSRDAIAFSSALEAIGAQLSSSASRDHSAVSIDVLSQHLGEALSLLSDALVKPRHDDRDFKRVTTLWHNALKSRGDDPNEVSRLVTQAALYGEDHPYGRPTDGTLASAARIKRDDIVRHHHATWRPEQVTFVVVGDVDQARITELLERSFSSWKALEKPPEPPRLPPRKQPPRTVLVDRPEAPQVVLSVTRHAVSAAHPDLPALSLANVALGGSFTSRLNQNLREDHGWTYGARSRFVGNRLAGMFVARAAIKTDNIGDALRETLREIEGLSADGLASDELSKVRALSRADVIEAYGSLHAITSSLAESAALGLPPDQDARFLRAQLSASGDAIKKLTRLFLSTTDATIVLVGPRDAALKAIRDNKLPEPEERDAEGRPRQKGKGAPRPKKKGR